MKLIKNNVVKEIENEKEIADYMSAGWKEKKEDEIKFPKGLSGK